jgi:hypothetical protein
MVACQIASPTNVDVKEISAEPDAGKPEGGAASAAPPASSPACGTSDFTKPDTSALTACGNGKGHCYDKSKSPIADQLTACSDATQVCVPDEMINANGSPLKNCASIIGPGACVTASLIPAIIQQGGSALKQDVCEGGQLCVPCNDPTHNNAPTPFCQPIGIHKSACTGAGGSGGGNGADAGSGMEACCKTGSHSGGVCIAETAVPASQRDQTIQETCPSGNKCVPASLVSNKPVTCSALLGRGVCIDKCFNDLLSLASVVLGQDGCGQTEVCLPCFAVKDMGVPGCS